MNGKQMNTEWKTPPRLKDVIDIEVLQYLQDNFAKAMGLSFITVDYKGRPFTPPSNFKRFCLRGREHPEFEALCAQCDAHGGLHSSITDEPYIYLCHADLVDFAVPLIVGGSYMGAVLGGQIKRQEGDDYPLKHIIPNRCGWEDDPELVELHAIVPSAPFEKIKAAVTLLRDMIQYLLEVEYNKVNNLQLEQTTRQLIEEKAIRVDLEESIQQKESTNVPSPVGPDFFFQNLNIIAKMAYKEKAPNTEEIVYNFSEMMRYAMSESRIATLGEELDYMDKLLRIQKTQLGDSFTYEIKMPQEFRGTICPRLVFQPIVENALKHAIIANPEDGHIAISAELDGKDLLIGVQDNGQGITKESIEAILDPSAYQVEQKGRVGLSRVNRKLKTYFGRKYGIVIKSRQDGIDGTRILVRLPLGDGLALGQIS